MLAVDMTFISKGGLQAWERLGEPQPSGVSSVPEAPVTIPRVDATVKSKCSQVLKCKHLTAHAMTLDYFSGCHFFGGGCLDMTCLTGDLNCVEEDRVPQLLVSPALGRPAGLAGMWLYAMARVAWFLGFFTAFRDATNIAWFLCELIL